MHSGLLSAVKPDTPIFSDVEISEDQPLEATVLWEPPPWPTHKVLLCQFQYKRCQEEEWTQVSVRGGWGGTSFHSISGRWDSTPSPREHRPTWHLPQNPPKLT